MSDYGKLSAVVAEDRGSFLTADASATDTSIYVDDAGDFDYEGGVLLLNGAEYAYSGIISGETRDDPDEITLTDALEADADTDDTVAVVQAGQVAVDYWAWVDMDEGGSVMVPLRFDQLAGWPVGIKDPPVPVAVAEDLSGIEDAPGRQYVSSVQFINTDRMVITEAGEQTFPLSYEPAPGSLHVRWEPLNIPIDIVSVDGNVVTIADDDELMQPGDVLTAAYAINNGAALVPRDIETLIPYLSSGWKYKQVTLADATDYSAATFDDSGWSTGTAMFGNGAGVGVGAATNWTKDTSLWLRRTFPRSVDVTITVKVEDNCEVYVNGTLVGSAPVVGLGGSNFSPPFEVYVGAEHTQDGVNALAVRANDESGTNSGDATAVDIQVVGRPL